MTEIEHVVAVVDNPSGAESVLEYARDSVQRGGTATVVLLMTPTVKRAIRELARQQAISPVTAERVYLTQAREAIKNTVGGDAETIVSSRLAGVRCAFEAAAKVHATALTLPTSLAGRRGWGRAMAKAPMPVTVTPSRAA